MNNYLLQQHGACHGDDDDDDDDDMILQNLIWSGDNESDSFVGLITVIASSSRHERKPQLVDNRRDEIWENGRSI
jgi:hypothetical protein